MKNNIVLVLAATGVAIFPAFGFAGSGIKIGTGSPSGLYYTAGDAICRALNADFHERKVSCSVASSRGSASNVMELDANKLQFGLVQSDVQFHAMEGRDIFAFVGAAQDLRSVFSLHIEAFTVLVKDASSLVEIDDLKGKRLNLGPLGTGTRRTGEDLLEALGWSAADRSNITAIEPEQNAKALCDGEVDAVVYLVGHPSANIQQVTNTCPTRLLSLRPAAIEALGKDRPYYATVAIAGGLYPNTPHQVTTLGVAATLVTLATVPDAVVFALVESVFENLSALTAASPAFSSLEPAQMIRVGLSAPLHAGAEKYYRQKGWIGQNEALKGSSPSDPVAPSLRLEKIDQPATLNVKPKREVFDPAPNSELDSGSPKTAPAPLPARNRWEPDTSPF